MQESDLSMLALNSSSRAPMYLRIYRALRELIISGTLAGGERLPGEARLAELLGVGRSSLRTALLLLYEDGYVVTMHGKGTFVTGGPEDAAARAPSGAMPIRRRLERMGYTIFPGPASLTQVTDDRFLDEKLSALGQTISFFKQTFLIGGMPAVVSQSFGVQGTFGSLEELEELFDARVSHVCSSFHATSLKDAEFETSELRNAENLLLVTSVWYTQGGTPVAYVKDYLDNDICRFSLRQSK